MSVRFANPNEIKKWNQHILSNLDGGNITQSIELARLKSLSGWKPRFIFINSLAITIHERTIPLLGKFWYIPKGPGVTTPKELSTILDSLSSFAKSNGVFLIKIEPEIIKNNKNLSDLNKLKLIPTSPIQPNSSTVILDTSKTTEEIIADLPQKARHAIRRAYRDGVETRLVEPTEENFDVMLDLMRQTMADKPGLMREADYYKHFWRSYTNSGNGALFFAFQNGQPTAGAFVMVFGKKATYKDGGSIRQKIGYGTSHALQWEIINWLKQKRVTTYDLCGTPPASQISNKEHPHYGIGVFKTGFNKTITEFVGVYDIAIRPLPYKIWKVVNRLLIRLYYSKILKQMFY